MTVSVKEADAVSVPDVPLMVTVEVPAVAVALAVSVNTLELVDDAGLNEAVTPLGKLVAVNNTLPLNPFRSVTLIVSVAVEPWVTDRVVAEGARVKLCVELVTVSTMLVFAVVLPEVPVIVTVAGPTVAALLAVKVRALVAVPIFCALVAVTGLVAKAAVTPVGRPDAAKVTVLVVQPKSATVIVSMPLLP